MIPVLFHRTLTFILILRSADARPRHRNVARSLNNMVYAKRLIALQLRRKIDADAARRRKAAARGRAKNGLGKLQYRNRFEQLRQEALAELAEAAAIYEQ